MEVTFNNMGAGLNTAFDGTSAGFGFPRFGFQKYWSGVVNSIHHTIHHCWDYKGKATTREVVIFALFFILAQAVLLPAEAYTTQNACWSMLVASLITDVALCVMPAVALIARWVRGFV